MAKYRALSPVLILVLGALVALAGCSSSAQAPAAPTQPAAAPAPTKAAAAPAAPAATSAPAAPAGNLPPLKIGIYGALTGTFASSGKDTLDGLNLYLKGINNTIAGRQVQVISEDTAGDPNNALTKARKLIEQDKVDVLVGPTTAAEGYAVRNYIDQSKVMNLFPVVSGDDITQRQRTPWIIRTGWTSSQPAMPFGKYVYDQGKKNVAIIAYDYSFGWENVGGFQKAYEDAGGKVIQKIWTPQTTPDFAPYLPQIKKNIDALIVVQSGSNADRFLQQWQDFGLKGTVPLYGLSAVTDEALLKTMGDEALGLTTILHWSAALQTPEAQAFVKKFEDMSGGNPPGYRAESAYVSAEVFDKAVQALKGNITSQQALGDAMRAVKITDAPRGPISFDQYGGVIQNEYVRKVEKVNGKLQNTVIATIPNVSQFFTYDPAKFMAEPPFSHDYPPCPNCQ